MVLLNLSTKLQLIGVDYQLRLKICQNILHSHHCFMSQNACLSLMLQQHSLSLSPKVMDGPFLFGHLHGSVWVAVFMEDYHLCKFMVFWKNSMIIGSILIIVNARQPKYHWFYLKVSI